MDDQNQPTVAIPSQREGREITEPARVQAWPGDVDQVGIFGVTTRQSELLVRVVAAPCSSRVLTWLTGAQ